MKYTIKNIEFKNKSEITNYCRDIILRNANNKLSGDDLYFMLDILSYHKNKSKLDGLKSISVDYDKWCKNLCLWIEKETSTGQLVIDDISWTSCIANIPFSEEKKIDYIFKFGKYNGKSIYDIEDRQYIEWLLENFKSLHRKDKVLLNQFLKYGYIPYNPAFNNHKKSTT